jgi:hypothetical protein
MHCQRHARTGRRPKIGFGEDRPGEDHDHAAKAGLSEAQGSLEVTSRGPDCTGIHGCSGHLDSAVAVGVGLDSGQDGCGLDAAQHGLGIEADGVEIDDGLVRAG